MQLLVTDMRSQAGQRLHRGCSVGPHGPPDKREIALILLFRSDAAG